MDSEDRQEEQTPSALDEGTGDAALDERLSEGVLKGYAGIDRAQTAIGAALIAVVAVIAFGNAIGLSYHLDDQRAIIENEALHRFSTVSQGWDGVHMRPVAALSVALSWVLGAGGAGAFHAMNLLLHLFNGVCVYLICRRLVRGSASEAVSMIAGMLFVAHPGVTQAVNELSSRPSLLGASFMLFSLVLYLRATADEAQPRYGAWAVSLLCFVLAWGATLSAWILPVLVLLVDAVARPARPIRRRVYLQAPHWMVLAVLMVVRIMAEGVSVREAGSSVLTSARAIGSFLVPAMYPVGLQVYHAPFDTALSGVPVLWCVMLIIGIVLMRVAPMPGMALLWFLATALASGGLAVRESFNEAQLYLPLAGAVIIAPWAVQALPKAPLRQIGAGVCALLILGGVALTSTRNNQWHSEAEIWIRAYEACPTCARTNEHLAFLHLFQGERILRDTGPAGAPAAADGQAEAQQHFSKAAEFFASATAQKDVTAEVWVAYSVVRNALGDRAGAREALETAVRLDPAHHRALLLLAALHADHGQQTGDLASHRKAVDYYRVAEALRPLPESAASRYARSLAALGDLRGSAAALRPWVADPAGPHAATLNEVTAKLQVIRIVQSRFNELQAEDPDRPELRLLTARQLHLYGRYLSSNYVLWDLFRDGQGTKDAWLLLALNSARMGSFDGFLAEWPDGYGGGDAASTWNDLADFMVGANQWDAALAVFRHRAKSVEDGSIPLVLLGDLAVAHGNLQRAAAYYQAAAKENPNDPGPWVAMAEMALTQGQNDAARYFIGQAADRGAAEPTLSDLRARGGFEPANSRGPRRTIIR